MSLLVLWPQKVVLYHVLPLMIDVCGDFVEWLLAAQKRSTGRNVMFDSQSKGGRFESLQGSQ